MATAPELGGTYYPSCVVNLMLRFDENFSIDAKLTPGASTPAPTGSPNPPSMSTGTPLFGANVTRPGSSLIGRIPKTASIELPGLRRPGSFSLTFDYRDLPIDPRLVRAVGVEIFLDTVTANDFAAGIVHLGTDGQRASTPTAQRRLSAVNQSPDNLVLKGVVDNWHVSHGTSGSTATIEGRDLVGLFLNTPLAPEKLEDLRLDAPIDDVIRQLVNKISDWAQNLDVVASPAQAWPDSAVPKLANIEELNPNMPRVREQAEGKKPRRSAGADQVKLNFWDLITRYCGLVGAVPYCTVAPNATRTADQGYKTTLMIVPQWGLYDYLSAGKASSPFRGGRRSSPDKVRRLMFGRNIEELTWERKFQGITARAVKVICYNPSSKERGAAKVLTATSESGQSFAARQGMAPPVAVDKAAASRSGVAPNGEASEDDVLQIYVKGVTDQAQLQTLANGLYEEIMRGELGGSVKTRALASFGGNNQDPDLLYIRPRDPLTISVDIRPNTAQVPNVSTPAALIDQARSSIARLEQQITQRTGDAVLAKAVAYSSRSAVAELQNTFRVNAVRFDWDIASGVSVSLDFHNYVMARNAIMNTPPAAAAPPAGGVARAAGGNSAPASRKGN